MLQLCTSFEQLEMIGKYLKGNSGCDCLLVYALSNWHQTH